MNLSQDKITTVMQGQYHVSNDDKEVLSTVLGSCVAMCLFDLDRKIGGMNHFLLPGGSATSGGAVKYGTHAVEVLINDLLKRGAQKSNMKAKLFGGAHLQAHLSDIGGSNAAFAREFLRDEGIPCLGESLGGRSARRIKFWPTTGAVRHQLVPVTEVNEDRTVKAPPPAPEVELF